MTAVVELKAKLDTLLSTAQAETANTDLFAPITDREECSICMIPLPLDAGDTKLLKCCGKMICNGCLYKNVTAKGTADQKCAYCRQPMLSAHDPKNYLKGLKKLMKKNNPHAFMHMALEYSAGEDVFQSDTKALQMYTCAAELGRIDAYTEIGRYYNTGKVVGQDRSKALTFYKISAKKGSMIAHQLLAKYEEKFGNTQNRIGHLKVLASAGDQQTMNSLIQLNLLSKDDLTQTLCACQASQNEMKSKDRDDARAIRNAYERNKMSN